MPGKRRLTFQLTPLLDLLLIVMFAQYMEVQQTAASSENEIEERASELEQRKSRLTAEFEARRLELERQYAKQNESLATTRQRYSEQFQSVIDQQQQAGNALAKALNLPGTLVEEVLQLRSANSNGDADRLEAAAAQLQQVLKSRGSELLRFLIRFDEMQKHVSVWEIHIQESGQVLFTDNEQTTFHSFETVDEFVTRSFESSKSFSEPKPLVIVLVTYGDCQKRFRDRATAGMPLLVERLRRDAGNTRWFDFSLMGFRPQGPIITSRPNGQP